ncbi:MAG: transposase [Leptospiraceae bacterium]|nr:transposase [Leptospiraceae bacterium]
MLFSCLKFPHQIIRMNYIRNWIEKLKKVIRRSDELSNSFQNPDSSMNLIYTFLIEYKKDFSRYKFTSFVLIQGKLNLILVLRWIHFYVSISQNKLYT